MFFSSCSQNISRGYFYVRTTDSLPFLNYGPGEDRLGGAKMTFLDSNIVLKVIDSAADKYKVQLSKFHSAYIEKRHVKAEKDYSEAQHLTGRWKVYGDSLYDYATIQLDEKLPYRSVMEINPSRIVVDIFGVASNTNWITQLSTVKEISATNTGHFKQNVNPQFERIWERGQFQLFT